MNAPKSNGTMTPSKKNSTPEKNYYLNVIRAVTIKMIQMYEGILAIWNLKIYLKLTIP